MYIEIFQENANKCVKTVKTNNFYYQTAYLNTDTTKFPVEIQISLEESTPHYPAGKYTLDDSSFKVNQYQNLELNRFAIRLKPMVSSAEISTPSAVKKAS